MQKQISQKCLKKATLNTRLNRKQGEHELKRRIKRGLKCFKKYVSKLKVIQKFLFVITTMLKQVKLYSKLKLSAFLQFTSQLKTRMITMIPHGLRIIKFIAKKRKNMVMLLVIVASLVLNLFLFSTISGQLSTSTEMYSYGSIKVQTAGIAVYRDSGCTTKLSSVPWGTLTPGSIGSYTIYVRNEGSIPLSLFFDTANWSPSNAAYYMTLNSNYGGQTIEKNQVIMVTLRLTVAQSISGISTFGFDIVLTGTEAG